ncbi:DUF6804 family protein [Ruicaihuangia caeni]|uniref:DUF6804 family protein n=1 Tax=Ruicaihuangia caeni TaxID=3042517 RepID=UPI00338E6836
MTEYRTPARRRTALLPAILLVLALLIGAGFSETDGFTVVRYVVSIFALIMVVFALQTKNWVFPLPLLAIAVLWNPVWPIDLAPDLWRALHYIAGIVVVLAGVFIKQRTDV